MVCSWYTAFLDGGELAASSSAVLRHNRRFNLLYTDGHVAPSSLRELQFGTKTEATNYPPWIMKNIANRFEPISKYWHFVVKIQGLPQNLWVIPFCNIKTSNYPVEPKNF
jgi:prepilin-type processing-associated H-X9-DG protein